MEIAVDRRPRCWECGRILAFFAARPWLLQCSRCKAICKSPD